MLVFWREIYALWEMLIFCEEKRLSADGEMSLSGLLSSRNGDFADDKFRYLSYGLKRVGFIRVLFVTVCHVWYIILFSFQWMLL